MLPEILIVMGKNTEVSLMGKRPGSEISDSLKHDALGSLSAKVKDTPVFVSDES